MCFEFKIPASPSEPASLRFVGPPCQRLAAVCAARRALYHPVAAPSGQGKPSSDGADPTLRSAPSPENSPRG